VKNRNQEGRTAIISVSDIPCEMNKSMGSFDGVEDFRRRSIYDKNVSYKTFVAFIFALLARLGNHGRRTVTGVPFFSTSK